MNRRELLLGLLAAPIAVVAAKYLPAEPFVWGSFIREPGWCNKCKVVHRKMTIAEMRAESKRRMIEWYAKESDKIFWDAVRVGQFP